MQVVFDSKEVKERLNQLSPVVGKDSTTLYMKFVRLFTEENTNELGGDRIVYLEAVSQVARFTVKLVKAKANGDVNALLPYNEFAGVVSVLGAEKFILDVAETQLVLKAGSYLARFQSHPVNTWPEENELPASPVTELGLPALQDQVKQINIAVEGVKNDRFTTWRMESNGQRLRLVSTDGHVLIISDVLQALAQFSFDINSEAAELIGKLEKNSKVIFYADEYSYFLVTATEKLWINRTHGTFPQYENYLPSRDKAQTLTVDSGLFRSAIDRQVPLFSKAEQKKLSFNVGEGSSYLNLESKHQSEGEGLDNFGQDAIEVKASGALSFKLNLDLIQPYLKSATGPLTIYVVDPAKPLEFSNPDSTYRMIVSTVS